MPILALAVSCGLFLCTAIYFYLAIRGQLVGDVPQCRNCDYNVSAITSTRCPECGSILRNEEDRTVGIRLGERQRSPSRVAVATVLFLGLGTFSVWFADQIQFNLSRYVPTSMLQFAAANGSSNAVIELKRRYSSGELSEEKIRNIVDRAIDMSSATGTSTAMESWLDLAFIAMAEGHTSTEQTQTVLGNSSILNLGTRPVVRIGDPIPIRVSHTSRGSKRVPVMVECVIGKATLGDNVVYDGKGSSTGFSVEGIGTPGAASWAGTIPLDTPTGDQTLTLTLRRKVHIGMLDEPATRTPDAMFDEILTTTVTILPAHAPDPLGQTQDVTMRDAIHDSISIPKVHLRAAKFPSPSQVISRIYLGDQATIIGTRNVSRAGDDNSPPVDLAFRVIIKTGHWEIDVGSITCKRGEHERHMIHYWLQASPEFIPELINAESVDVILRSDPDEARRTVDLENIWIGEIVIEDVPLSVSKPGDK